MLPPLPGVHSAHGPGMHGSSENYTCMYIYTPREPACPLSISGIYLRRNFLLTGTPALCDDVVQRACAPADGSAAPGRHPMSRSLAVALVCSCIGLLSAPDAGAQVQSKEQQKCITGLNKAGVKVSKAQGKEIARCIKNAAKGKELDPQACSTADAKLKVAKAKSKTTDAKTKKCTADPDFGTAPVGQINTAAVAEQLALAADLFGADLTAAVSTDKAIGGCQAAIAKAYEKVVATKAKVFIKCKKKGLKDMTIDSPAALEACFDVVASDAKVAKMIGKITTAVTKKCSTVILDTAFPGICVGAPVFADCVDASTECRTCLTLDAVDGLSRDCDLYDDGLANGSCASTPTTTTTIPSTTTTVPATTTTTVPPPASDWGLGCFASKDCGSSFCPGTPCVCDHFVESILVPPPPMCFFDCMDLSGTVTSCRSSCSGPSAAPACDTTVAGSGGFTGVVTGPGACEPSGFTVAPSFGGTATELKRITLTFAVPIDESTLFDGPPPACDPGCPTVCPTTAVHPLPDHFRLQIGTPPSGSEAEVCDREGIPVSVCKKDATTYIVGLDSPADPEGDVCTPVPLEFTLFISCHVGDGSGGFLHFSTGDFYGSLTWPP